MGNNKISTEFGTAYLCKAGYCIIPTKDNPNSGKLLHRLIWEKHYGKPKGVVTHIDGNKLNNDISNLQVKEIPIAMETEYGSVKLYGNYYRLTDGRFLHKVIYEDYHKVTILKGNHVHHIDGNKLNNDISNLELISDSNHAKQHLTGKKLPLEQCKKMSESRTGKGNWKYKSYARVVKKGFDKGKQVYGLVYDTKLLKRSVDKDKLQKLADDINNK